MNGKEQASQGTADIGGCEWIDWDSNPRSWVHFVPDPTRIFSLLCLSIMAGRYLQATGGNWLKTVSGLFLNLYVVVYFLTACWAAYWGRRHAPAMAEPLKVYDRWTVEWYWWNAWLYHAVMDGSSGSLRLVPVVVQQYDMLDLRFATGHVVPWIIGIVELTVMYPLCLATVYCILSRSVYRFPLELITSTFQLMGMLVFVVSELYEGQVNIPALDPVGVDGHGMWANAKLNLYHFTYYWFGFWFCNLIWGFVPYYRLHRAACESARALGVVAAKTNQKVA